MAEEKTQEIVTLEAKEGKNPGEAIATYGRRNIVFLPKGAVAGQNVRVRLIELTKKDSRGNTMYRGSPAPDIEAEAWKDNGNNTASRIKTRTDWLGQSWEGEVIETRPLAKRDGQPLTKSDSKVVWGKDLPSSVIEERQATLIPLEEEKVEDGQLVWRKTGEREENIQTLSHPIKEIQTTDVNGKWPRTKLDFSSNRVVGNIMADQISVDLDTVWTEMPDWWKKKIEARFPICPCGKNRCDVRNADNYAKCEECREHEHCQRCGKESKITVINNQMVCDSCKAGLEQEQLINRLLTADQKTAIAAEVKKLLDSELTLEKAGGEAVLRSSMDHIASEARRSNLADKWSGYYWYYFAGDGIYGSKFSPSVLKILEFIPQASGNGLVEIVTWLAGGAKPARHDYYTLRQIEGDGKVEFTFSTLQDLLKEIVAKLAAKELILADLLRGSEKARVEALTGYRKIVEKFGSDSSQAREVEEILQDEKQDYSAALEKIREIEELIAAEKRGETLLGFEAWHRRGGMTNNGDGWVIRPDGSLRERDSDDIRRHKSDGTYRWEIVEPEDLAIRWQCHHRGDVAENSIFEAVKLPKDGCTKEQRETVAQIEKEIGAPSGSFDLKGKNKEARKEEKKEGNNLADEIARFNSTFGFAKKSEPAQTN